MYRARVPASQTADSWANRPALRIGSLASAGSAGSWAGTSKTYPCFCWSWLLSWPVKSLPTSGPLTVSSHDSQLPHGIAPPEQFIWLPLRLTALLATLPKRSTSTVVVPPPAAGS